MARKAVVYIRQSTPHQVVSNQESLRLQYALRQRARELGRHEADIDVIDADLGLSGASAAQRSGFKELVGRVGLSEVGLILSIDVTRLARNCSDWYPLLDSCAASQEQRLARREIAIQTRPVGGPKGLRYDKLGEGASDSLGPAPPENGLCLLVPVDHVPIRSHDDDAVQGDLKDERQNRGPLGGRHCRRGTQLHDASPLDARLSSSL